MKMEEKGISTAAIVGIVVTVVVVTVVGGVAAVILLQPGTTTSGGTTTTTTPGGMTTTPGITTTTTPTTTTAPPTTTPTTTTPGGGIGSATSISFKEDIISEGITITAIYSAKNIGSDQMKMRIEVTTGGLESTTIINGELQQVWIYASGVWMDMSGMFSNYWDLEGGSVNGVVEQLSGWTGGDITHSMDGTTVRIYDIVPNPQLDDSLFVYLG